MIKNKVFVILTLAILHQQTAIYAGLARTEIPIPKEPTVFYIENFDTSKVVGTGGKTGSGMVKGIGNENRYQLKLSIKDAAKKRGNKEKAKFIRYDGTEVENFGEVIAASYARHLFNDKDFIPAPDVSPVINRNSTIISGVGPLATEYVEATIPVVSQYLQATQDDAPRTGGSYVRTLDAYAKEKGITLKQKVVKTDEGPIIEEEHVKIVNKPAGTTLEIGEMNLQDQTLIFRDDLALGIALSALLGDWDVNPGNFIVLTNNINGQDVDRVARIDFGHALNDLVASLLNPNRLKMNKPNQIMNFFNDEKLLGSSSKLWRDYPGLIPSQELVDAMLEIAGLQKAAAAGEFAPAQKFLDLLATLDPESKQDTILANTIANTFIKINNAIDGKKISKNLSPLKVVLEVSDNIEKFFADRAQEMLEVATLMQLQVDIDTLIRAHVPGQPADKELQNKIQKGLGNATTYQGSSEINWLKTDPKKPSFKGTLEEYILERTKQLALAQ